MYCRTSGAAGVWVVVAVVVVVSVAGFCSVFVSVFVSVVGVVVSGTEAAGASVMAVSDIVFVLLSLSGSKNKQTKKETNTATEGGCEKGKGRKKESVSHNKKKHSVLDVFVLM